MISKGQLLNAILKECRLCKRLATKISPGALEYRPTPGQRSILELLRYISFAHLAMAHTLVDGNWNFWKAQEEQAKQMQAEGFPAAMDRQMADLKDFFLALSEEVLQRPVQGMPWRTDQPLGVELMEHCYAFAVGYRMQLFLYAKAAGAANLDTADCWFATEDENRPW